MRILYTSMMVALAATLSYAESLTPEQALQRALGENTRMSRGADFELVYSQPDAEAPAYYVFNQEGAPGYMLVAGDDICIPVLGYSDKDSFDPASIPPQMKWLMDKYAAQIAMGRAGESRAISVDDLGLTGKAAISPKLKTTWNQGAPYNNDCPSDAGGKTVTGCVATALAQVMNYFQYSACADTIATYTCGSDTTDYSFKGVSFDWANMIDDYSGSYTTAQAAAVAKLMLACGAATNMKYSSNESSANLYVIPTAMPNIMGYDQYTFTADRAYYTLAGWHQLVYEQLEKVGPVTFGGVTPANAGHCFICDGYDGKGYFHFNWGWGGLSDGYFMLDALDPISEGIGGADGNFAYLALIVGGIQPSSGSFHHFEIICSSLTMPTGTYSKSATLNVTTDGFYSFSNAMPAMQIGLKFTKDNDNSVIFSPGYENTAFAFGYMSGINDQYMLMAPRIPSTLTDGTYTMTIAAKIVETGEYVDVAMGLNQARSWEVTVSGTSVKIGKATVKNPTLSSLTASESFQWASNDDVNLKFTVDNSKSSAEFYDSWEAILCRDGVTYAISAPFIVDVPAGSTRDFDLYTSFSAWEKEQDDPYGEYELYLMNKETSKKISSTVYTTITVDAPEPSVIVGYDDINLPDFVADESNRNIATADTPFTTTVEFTNSGEAAGEVQYYFNLCQIDGDRVNTSVKYAYSDISTVYLEAGETKSWQQTIDLCNIVEDDIPAGKYALGVINNTINPATGSYGYKYYWVNILGALGGIADVVADDINAETPVSVYSLDGRTIYSGAYGNLNLDAPGIYILRTPSATYKLRQP